MNLRQIEAFRAVMLTGSMTQAGAFLHVSQPAISRLIADFEYNVGFRLFEREHGRVSPTGEAESLYAEVERSFIGLDRIEAAARSIAQLRRGSLRVIAVPVLAQRFLPRAIADFLRHHPDVAVEFDSAPRETVVAALAAHQYDLGLAALPVSEPAVSAEVWRRQEAVCALPARSPLAAKATVTVADLDGLDFVSLPLASPFRRRIDEVFDRAGVRRLQRVAAPTQQAVCTLVAAGAGVSVVDPIAARDMAGADLMFRPLRPRIAWEIGLLRPAARPMPRLAGRFCDLLRAAS